MLYIRLQEFGADFFMQRKTYTLADALDLFLLDCASELVSLNVGNVDTKTGTIIILPSAKNDGAR